MGYKREQGLTIKQENAIDLLITGDTDAAVAKAVGVNRVTVTKWRNYDIRFQAELNVRRKEVWGASVDRLRSLLPRALDALEEELADGKQRGRIALEILRLTGLDRSGPKHSSLDSYGIGPTDPAVIVEGVARSRRPDEFRDLIHGERVSETELQSALNELDRLLAST